MARLQLSLTAVSFICLLVFASGVFSQSTFTIVNSCSYPIWPGLLSAKGAPQLPTTGFLLNPNYYTSIPIPAGWTGNLWGRTLCSTDSSGRFSCVTGDCGSGAVECNGGGGGTPDTLAEFNLDADGLDYYDLSLVNGFNVPMNIAPQDGACGPAGCSANINGECPAALQDVSGGQVVACKSACVAFGDPRDCCTGAYQTPATCGPTPYSEFFKNACPQGISYAFDSGVLACPPTSYTITFCP